MITRILMPQVPSEAGAPSELRWLVDEGDRVEAGEAVAEILCPRGRFAIWSVEAGRMVRLLAEGAGAFPAGRALAVMDLDGDAGQGGARPADDTPAPAPVTPHLVQATPRAARLAAEADLDVTGMAGSGPGGRVIASDVTGAVRRASAEARATTRTGPSARHALASAPTPAAAAGVDLAEPLDERGSVRPVTLTLAAVCLADRLIALRRDLVAGRRYGPTAEPPPSITDFLLKAWALALAEVPSVNVVARAGRLVRADGVTLALMSSAPSGPFRRIASADRLSLTEIAAARRRGGIAPGIGEPGLVTSLVVVIDQPDIEVAALGVPSGFATALGIGAISERASVIDGRLSVAPALTVTLCLDSALVDPGRGGDSLAVLRNLIEEPRALLD